MLTPRAQRSDLCSTKLRNSVFQHDSYIMKQKSINRLMPEDDGVNCRYYTWRWSWKLGR